MRICVDFLERTRQVVARRARSVALATPFARRGEIPQGRKGTLVVGRSRRAVAAWVALFAMVSALGTGAAVAANGSVAYTYDALGRVIAASYDTGVCITYTYDANGNRLSEKIIVVAAGTTGVWGCFRWNQANWGP